jgi:hypothetical protein
MEYWGGKNYFVFIGDSRLEQMYHGFIHQVSPGYQGAGVEASGSGRSSGTNSGEKFLFPLDKLAKRDLMYNDTQLGLRVQFLWYPYPNKSMITAMQQWKVTPALSQYHLSYYFLFH